MNEQPVAFCEPKILQFPHGEQLLDNYFWLREKDTPEKEERVVQYIKEENNYTEKVVKHTMLSELQREIEKEFEALESSSTKSFASWKNGNYLYHRGSLSSFVLYRRSLRSADLNAGNEDEVVLSRKDSEYEFSYFLLSPENRYIAFFYDVGGDERFTCCIKDLERGEVLSNEIIRYVSSMEPWLAIHWSMDSNYLFYVKVEENAACARRLYRHRIGTSCLEDVLLYEEEDSAFVLMLSRSNDRRYLFMTTASSSSAEVWYLESDQPQNELKCFQRRKANVMYWLEHHNRFFYMGTNEGAINFKLLQIPLDGVQDRRSWREVLAHDPEIYRVNMDSFSDYLVVYEQSRCQKRIRIVDLAGEGTANDRQDEGQLDFERNSHYVPFPEEVYSFSPGNIHDNCIAISREKSRCEYTSSELIFSYTSFKTPLILKAYDMRSRTTNVLFQMQVNGYDPDRYQTERLFVKSRDGTMVPMSLIYRKDLRTPGVPNLCIMSGYGAYGTSKETRFSLYRLALLNRGFIYVIAHVRGGSEMGRLWHERGRLLFKRNSFEDFIACAEYLIEHRYTDLSRLTIRGRSAGGLLMCGLFVMRPDLFRSAVVEVPFVDALVSMADTSVPWTSYEFDEWGNSNVKEYFDYIKTYCPITNIKPCDYGNILITNGFNDSRVQYWEPAKFVAKLRANQTNPKNLILLKTYMNNGHFARERSLLWAFFIATTNASQSPK